MTRNLFILFLVFACNYIFAQVEHNIESGDTNIHFKVFGEGTPILIINGGP